MDKKIVGLGAAKKPLLLHKSNEDNIKTPQRIAKKKESCRNRIPLQAVIPNNPFVDDENNENVQTVFHNSQISENDAPSCVIPTTTPQPPITNFRKRLILEYKYLLNSGKCICVGMDPLRNFEVVVRLIDEHNTIICFILKDWHEFALLRTTILDFFRDKNNIEYCNLRKHQLYFEKIFDNHILLVKWFDQKMCLDLQSTTVLFSLVDVINNYIEFLNSLNFNYYYTDIICKAYESFPDYNIINNVNSLLPVGGNIYTIAMKEVISIYPDIIQNLHLIF